MVCWGNPPGCNLEAPQKKVFFSVFPNIYKTFFLRSMYRVRYRIDYRRCNCRVIQELRTISNTAVTLRLPIIFVNIFINVLNAYLTVFIPIIFTYVSLTVC